MTPLKDKTTCRKQKATEVSLVGEGWHWFQSGQDLPVAVDVSKGTPMASPRIHLGAFFSGKWITFGFHGLRGTQNWDPQPWSHLRRFRAAFLVLLIYGQKGNSRRVRLLSWQPVGWKLLRCVVVPVAQTFTLNKRLWLISEPGQKTPRDPIHHR